MAPRKIEFFEAPIDALAQTFSNRKRQYLTLKFGKNNHK
jgi:hypothetical protein